MAVPFPMTPAMTFVEDEQWILAIYQQNEVRKVKPGQEAEIALQDVSGPHHQVQGGLDHVGHRAGAVAHRRSQHLRAASRPSRPTASRSGCSSDAKDKDLFLAAGAHGAGAIYTDSGHMIHIIRKVIVRVGTKLDWLILKLH